MKQPAIYIMASTRNGTLYVGVTSNLLQRAWQHRNGATASFASKHQCAQLVHFELYADMTTAIAREKQIKSGSRTRKLALIESTNPDWRDLYDDIT